MRHSRVWALGRMESEALRVRPGRSPGGGDCTGGRPLTVLTPLA